MRLTGGRLRGRTITAPKRTARPTTDRTRESIFNILQARIDLEDIHVLDLFAGSGALGFEALSRGAAHVTFVEKARDALRTIKANGQSLGVAEQVSIIRADARTFLARGEGPPFDLILADPPYDDPDISGLPDLAIPRLTADGLFVLEHDGRTDFSDHPGTLISRKYGGTTVTLFAPPPAG